MIRRPVVRITVTRWDFPQQQPKDSAPWDITDSVISFTWRKTIKSPASDCEMQILPQRTALNLLDDLSPQDVVSIYEFGTLKYQGYIVTISFTGAIQSGTPGVPLRRGTIQIAGFGNLIATASLGLNMGNFKDNFEAFWSSAQKLAFTLNNVLSSNGSTYATALSTTFQYWTELITNIGATDFSAYLSSFLDYSTALDTTLSPSFPRNLYLWTGTEVSVTLWEAVLPMIQVPLNEVWFDVGPRNVYLNGTTQSNVQLPNELTYLIFRATPFDGTLNSQGESENLFQALPIKTIPKEYLVRFDLHKTSTESYTVYNVVEPIMQMNDITRALLGLMVPDPVNINKYLLRMMTTQLYFSRQVNNQQQNSAPSNDPLAPQIETQANYLSQTLLNWYTNNDQFLSGTIMGNVPNDANSDIYLGERVQIESIPGTFYVEGISHQWTMNQPLFTTLSVTRGYNQSENTPIQLVDKLFRSGIPIEDINGNAR